MSVIRRIFLIQTYQLLHVGNDLNELHKESNFCHVKSGKGHRQCSRNKAKLLSLVSMLLQQPVAGRMPLVGNALLSRGCRPQSGLELGYKRRESCLGLVSG